jgi:hypothetical protein
VLIAIVVVLVGAEVAISAARATMANLKEIERMLKNWADQLIQLSKLKDTNACVVMLVGRRSISAII